MISVLTPAPSLRLTTPERVAADLGLPADQAATFADLVDEVSSDIESFVGYRLVREQVRETRDADGARSLYLERTPIAQFDRAAYEETDVPTVVVRDASAGELYAPRTFTNTQPLDIWIRPSQGRPPGEPSWVFDYWGGFLTRADDVTASGTASASASASAFELSAGAWPLLVSGDAVTALGFTEAANNRRFTVLSRTVTTLVVSPAPVDETLESGVATFAVRNLPGELERAALDEIKTRYLSRSRASDITSERIGDWAATYGGTSRAGSEGAGSSDTGGFSSRMTLGKLERWRRIV